MTYRYLWQGRALAMVGACVLENHVAWRGMTRCGHVCGHVEPAASNLERFPTLMAQQRLNNHAKLPNCDPHKEATSLSG